MTITTCSRLRVTGVRLLTIALVASALEAQPAAGAPAVVWIIGTYAFIFGLMMIVLAFRLRGLSGQWRSLREGCRNQFAPAASAISRSEIKP